MRGASCTGKTRTAYEAVRNCLADWQLVFPKTSEGLLALLDAGVLVPRTVLWLNEAQNHLSRPGGERAAAALHGRLEEPGPFVVLGTLWPEYHRDLTATPQPGEPSPNGHPHSRALLDLAVLVDVPASFAAEALKDPRVNRDASLAAAARTSTDGRLTQTLAAGPQLVDHYAQPTEPHGPYGHAIITAAMDARRLGHTSPLPAALLRAAAPAYLTAQQHAAADPDTWFDGALDYAREKVRGVAAALEPVADPDGMGSLPDVYRLSDYLDHHARSSRFRTFPPVTWWTAVRDHAAGPADMNALADAARQRGRYHIAADLYRRAAELGSADALTGLAWLLGRDGDTEGAEQLHRRAADAGSPEALTALALRMSPDAEETERFALRAADAGEPLGLRELARYRLMTRGRTDDTEPLLRHVEDLGSDVLMTLALLRERAGDAEGAERFAHQAVRAGDPWPLAQLARQRWSAGDVEDAERLVRRAADAGNWRVVTLWARMRAESGDGGGGERLYRQAADAGDALAAAELAWMCERAGDVEEAVRIVQRAADGGDTYAFRRLAELRAGAGNREGAELLLRRAADARDTVAMGTLARLREEAGDVEGAEQIALRAADAGHPLALTELAQRRTLSGDLAGAERMYRRAADAQSTAALTGLARLRNRVGDTEGAERLYQQAVDAGDTAALRELAQLRASAGDTEGARRLRPDGGLPWPQPWS
ncbi:tetratricopeptide repeat protein [Streptomyces sp. NPDC004111]|uniref:tetratricopeptide repeat protein n=1 Tax=Streptomyces sp. NPDC004111 TaxID=3364690 RepID=UPI0036C44208